MSNQMAWRPYENLIDGELNNRTPGKVVGWMRFSRRGKRPLRVTLDLVGDFHEDIFGRVIRLKNEHPSDRNESLSREGTYMEGFCRVQRGVVGDITAGLSAGRWTEKLTRKLFELNEPISDKLTLTSAEREKRRTEFIKQHRKHIDRGDLYYPYVTWPYLEWFSDNGRVVLELDRSQVKIVGGKKREKTLQDILDDIERRSQAMTAFLADAVKQLSEENRKRGGDGDVTATVVG